MSQGQVHTFASLRADVDFIEIPIIQRDYAQGRSLAADVRKAFLDALHKALQPGAPALDLDFVYGSVAVEGSRRLSVLDGQQRLTTLFLLHWYLAIREGQTNDFRQRWTTQGEGRSRFTYATRPSAAEFFQALVRSEVTLPADGGVNSLSAALLDSKWFFDAWRRDPTVNSCLVMLDAIHDTFGGDELGRYATLVDGLQVTFHFLNLRDFGLSDDLYIKMNSRGKPLTAFENFKAWLVERAGNATWADEFAHGMDQRWLDFFWELSGRSGATKTPALGQIEYDELFLRFFYLQAYFESCLALDDRFWMITATKRLWLARIREARGYVPLRDLEAVDVLGPTELAGSVRVLEFLSSSANERFRAMLLRALAPRAGYDDQLHLHALAAFLRSPSVSGLGEAEFAVCLGRWLRLTANLIRNSRIDEPAIAASMVKGLTELAEHAADLYRGLADKAPTQRGFSREQAMEESRKASLILQDPTWEAVLVEAEAHWYLQGRVGFLLDLSADESSAIDRERFVSYATTMNRVVTRAVLESPTHVLPRALLSLYDYLPSVGGGNLTFCVSKATAYRDRLENWLAVFQDSRFGQLLDAVGEGGANALEALIANSDVRDWRRPFVKHPALFDYCGMRLVRKYGRDLLLLSKSRLTGYFAEVHSLALFHELSVRRRTGALQNVGDVSYRYVYGDEWPDVQLHLGREYRVSYSEGCWRCQTDEGEVVDLPEEVANVIRESAGDAALLESTAS